MRDLRLCYRAQYLQKLAEVVRTERQREEENQLAETERRRARKRAHLAKVAEDRKRRAILRDRLRVERKVNEVLEMQRRSKLKRRRLLWLGALERQREEKLLTWTGAGGTEVGLLGAGEAGAKNVAPGSLPLSSIGGTAPAQQSPASITTTDKTDYRYGSTKPLPGDIPPIMSEPDSLSRILDRDVSVPHILRQTGAASTYPRQKNRRITGKQNLFREVLEESYELLPEDVCTETMLREPPTSPASAVATTMEPTADTMTGPSGRKSLGSVLDRDRRAQRTASRAKMEYGNFSDSEKRKMLDEKIAMLQVSIEQGNEMALTDNVQQLLLDQLVAARLAMDEERIGEGGASDARASDSSRRKEVERGRG